MREAEQSVHLMNSCSVACTVNLNRYTLGAFSLVEKSFWLVLSVFLNAFGNALTVKAALGSAPWTAASLNLSHVLGITVGEALIIMGAVVLVADDLLRQHWNGFKDFFNFLYVLSFGYVVDMWLVVMRPLNFTNPAMRVALCVIGILCIGAALSIYFRVNLVLHPFDDLLKIIREKYLHGNVVRAQRIALGIPLVIGLTIGLMRHQLVGISLGTAISFLCTGYFILLFDKTIQLDRIHDRLAGWHLVHRPHHSKA